MGNRTGKRSVEVNRNCDCEKEEKISELRYGKRNVKKISELRYGKQKGKKTSELRYGKQKGMY